jgi:hypothetical protein
LKKTANTQHREARREKIWKRNEDIQSNIWLIRISKYNGKGEIVKEVQNFLEPGSCES